MSGFDYTYIDINALGLTSLVFRPLLGLEPMALIRPQLPASHANHSATETSLYVYMYVCGYVGERVILNY